MKQVRDWLARGPFAIAASTLQGGMNFLIVLYLSLGQSLAATGEYRTIFSWYGLLSLASMYESNKVFIRDLVKGDRRGLTAIVVNRFIFSGGAFLAIFIVWLAGRASGSFSVPNLLPVVAGISVLVYPSDLYLAHLQAQRRFIRLFIIESIKYGGALLLFFVMIQVGYSIAIAVIAQLSLLAAFNMLFFAIHSSVDVDLWRGLRHPWAMLRDKAAQDARTYSIANMFPASLENVDKLLVGAVFGLKWLGVYTLAYSTGRFLYNIIKPAMYVYYRRFVNNMPGWPLLRKVTWSATLLGVAMTAVFWVGIIYVPALGRFESGRWATTILFLGYGLGMLHAIYSQAFALNKDSIAKQAFQAHLIATVASLILLGLALGCTPGPALILLAFQYPVRDGLSVLLMDRYRRTN